MEAPVGSEVAVQDGERLGPAGVAEVHGPETNRIGVGPVAALSLEPARGHDPLADDEARQGRLQLEDQSTAAAEKEVGHDAFAHAVAVRPLLKLGVVKTGPLLRQLDDQDLDE